MILLPASRPKQPILWIAMVALLLGVLGSQLRYSKCVGDCCEVVATSCCDIGGKAHEQDSSCCGCCGNSHATSQSSEGTPSPLGQLRGACRPDCCVMVCFDIELAPAQAPVEPPPIMAMPYPVLPAAAQPMQTRQVVRQRPFDRGPPRIDQSTALRACTVLLI